MNQVVTTRMAPPVNQPSLGTWLASKATQVLRRWATLAGMTADPAFRGGAGSHAGVNVDMNGVLGLSTAWACVNLVAGTFGMLPLGMYRKARDGSRVEASDHRLHRLIHDQPNTEQTALEFWEFMQACLELRGNAYAEKMMIGDNVASLVPIAPDAVSPYRDGASGLVRYKVAAIDGRGVRDLGTREMFHIRGFGGDALGGLSTIQFGRQVFGMAIAVDRAAASTFANGMRPSGILQFADWLKPEQRSQAREYLESDYAESQRTGRPLVLEGGSTWHQLTLNPDDAQMLQSRQFNVEEVCRFFGVPPVMVGHNGQTTWGSGIEQIKLMFHTLSLARRARRIELAIQQQLMTAADRGQGLFAKFNMEGFLRGDSVGRSRFYAAGLRDGWLKVNEVRGWEDMAPVPGGDITRVQSQNVPLTAEPAPPPTVAIAGAPAKAETAPVHVHMPPVTIDVPTPSVNVDQSRAAVIKTVTKRDADGQILEWKEEPLT